MKKEKTPKKKSVKTRSSSKKEVTTSKTKPTQKETKPKTKSVKTKTTPKKTKTDNKLVVVGRTTQGYWKSITEQGFLNDFPDSTFTIDKPSTFPELSQGIVSVPEPLSKRFLEIKKKMTKENGGRWIIWD